MSLVYDFRVFDYFDEGIDPCPYCETELDNGHCHECDVAIYCPGGCDCVSPNCMAEKGRKYW